MARGRAAGEPDGDAGPEACGLHRNAIGLAAAGAPTTGRTDLEEEAAVAVAPAGVGEFVEAEVVHQPQAQGEEAGPKVPRARALTVDPSAGRSW